MSVARSTVRRRFTIRIVGLALLLIAAVVAGCSAHVKAGPRLGAAEPAVAPKGTVSPSGVVVEVGSVPEGIVYDAVTGLVAVTVRNPDRLILLDGASMKIVRSVRLRGHARHLQLARPGGPVLVPEENANVLGVVSLPSGSTTEIPTGKSPHDATAVSAGYVAGDEFGGSITIARTGQPEQTVQRFAQPGGVIGFDDSVSVVDVGTFKISTYRVSDGTELGELPGGAGPTHGVRTASGRLAVADTRGNALILFRPNPLTQLGVLPMPGTPYGLASDLTAPRIWVTLTARNQVVGLDVTATGFTEVARLDTVDQPDTVAVAPGSHTIWVTGTRAGVVQRLTR